MSISASGHKPEDHGPLTFGVLAGQALTALIGWMLQLDNSLLIGGVTWPVELWAIPALAIGVSLAAAILPAWGAYRVSVLELLQSR